MSLRLPSALSLLSMLQQHGLTYAQLLEFAQAVRQAHSGPVVFHVAQGHIRSIEVQPSRRQQLLRHD